MEMRTNIHLLLVGIISIFSSHVMITNNTYHSTTATGKVDEEALSAMVQNNEDRINRVLALCEDENEDEQTFIEKARLLANEHIQWQLHNLSLLSNSDLALLIDILWIQALQKLQQSVENQNNQLLKQKKLIAINIIAEGLKGNLHKFLQN
jgi:hypothetical protein